MKHRMLAGVVAIAATCLPAAAAEEPLAFILEMLRAVDAAPTICPDEVEELTKAREMSVVCARFDGEFEAFESRWMEHLLSSPRVAAEDEDNPTLFQTDWQNTEETYECIYAVDGKAVGVRFRRGELILVYR